VTRQALLSWVFEALQPTFEVPTEATFDDVPADHPSFVVVEWTAAVGLLSGYGDGTFRPDSALPQGAVASVLTKARMLADDGG
jgi:hypothetical protein